MDTEHLPKAQNTAPQDAPHPLVQEAIHGGHETTDVSVPGLFAFVVGLGVTLVAISIGLVVFFKVANALNTRLNGRIAHREPGAASRVHVAPDYNGPLLQVKPEEDLRWMRQHNTADLNGYGWVNRSSGVVRLPIDRAMDMLAQRGLPPISPHHTLEELQRMRAQPQVYGQSLRP